MIRSFCSSLEMKGEGGSSKAGRLMSGAPYGQASPTFHLALAMRLLAQDQNGCPTAKEPTMTNRRARAFATATVLGLGALGGVALGTNPGMPSTSQQAGGGSGQAIVTSTSGASALSAAQTVAVKSESSARAPIVTRSSGGGAPAPVLDD